MTWYWDTAVFDYVNDDDGAMGRERLLAFSRTSVKASTDKIDLLAARVADGLIPADRDWETGTRR